MKSSSKGSSRRLPQRITTFAALTIVLLAGLVLGSATAQAAPPRQGEPSPTPTLPPLIDSAMGIVQEANLATLMNAAHVENLDWGNVTVVADETLGNSEMSHLMLTYAIGQTFPNFEMPTLDGDVFTLAQAQGEGPLLLNFWASWCEPCRMEVPILLDTHEDPAAPFRVIMVNVWDEEASYLRYAEADLSPSLIIGRAADDLPDQIGIEAIPISVLLDAEQQIVAVHIGNLTPAVMNLLYVLAGAPAEQFIGQPIVAAYPQSTEEMAERVADANRANGGATLWREGVLGPDDGFRLAIQVGEKLPAFGLTTGQGEVFRLDVSGIPYLVNFWASWCGPCVAEFPLLIERHEDGENPYRVAFVNVWDDPYTAQRFLDDYSADLLTMMDSTGDIPDRYGIQFIPTSILVDAQGMVQMIQYGPVNEEALTFAAMLIEAP